MILKYKGNDTMNTDDLMVIDGTSDFHIFKSGERVTVIREFPNGKFLVMNDNGVEDIVLEEHLRAYTPIDEYEDMYCVDCGGTACMC